ncbi:hypothetical protein [Haloferula sp.]|uniref:hypothetical protein n=1 Tax=Haloferula sp. TaxID=2497595 RepID=UPI003C70FBC7
MNTKRPSPTLLLAISFLAGYSARADITYVDAIEGADGNTYAVGRPLADTSWESGLDNPDPVEDQWTKRTSVGGNSSTIFQGRYVLGNGDELPELATEITGLADGTYNIWVFYWDQVASASQNWVISTGFASSETLISFSSPGQPQITGATPLSVSDAGALAFTTDVAVIDGAGSENERRMFGVNLGRVKLSGGNSTVTVYVDNLIGDGENNRTWYDGVGFEPVAPITYIDAVEGIDGNTYATGSTLDDITWVGPDSPDTDNFLWNKRSPGNNSSLFQALPSGSPSGIPELTTEITGLTDGTYEVWAFYWDQVDNDTQNWVISAGLESGSLGTYSSPGEPEVPNATTAGVTNAADLVFTNNVLPAEDGLRNLFGVNLGRIAVSGGSPINVRVDMLLFGFGSSRRVWYDGVGYSRLSEIMQDSQLAITSFTSVGGNLWELSLKGEADSEYEFRSSSSLDFTPGTLVLGLSQGNPADPGLVDPTTEAFVTTDSNGDAKVRVTLTGDPTDFIRAESKQ